MDESGRLAGHAVQALLIQDGRLLDQAQRRRFWAIDDRRSQRARVLVGPLTAGSR